MKSTVFSAVVVSIGYTLLGWDFATLLEANLHMKKEFELENGPSIEGITVAVSAFGAIVITIFSGSLLDWLGRRAVLIHSSLLLFSGGLLMLWSPNIYILLVARLIVGSGSGLVFTCVPIYISETSPPNMRGSLGTMPQFMFFVGIIFSYCLIFWFTLMSSPNWRIMIGAIFAPSVLYFALLVFYLPESPRWLVSDGKINEARVSLQWLRGKHDVSGEIALIVDGMDIISETAIGIAQGQSFPGTSASQILPHSTFYWHLSDPLVDLLGSIHENMSEAGSRRNSFFPVLNSFSFGEHEQMNEHRDDVSDQQTREAYSVGEVNNGDGLRASLLSQAASVEVNDMNTSFTSEGSSSYLRRHGTSAFAQEFMASLHDYDIEEEEEIHASAVPHQPAYRDVENTGRHPFRQQMVRLSETADMKSKWRVLLQPGVRHALCYGMLIQALQQSAGISVLLRYTPEILEQVGVVSLFADIGLSPHSTSILMSILNALLMLPCITAAMLLMDVCGRRALLLVTTPILILSFSIMSLSNMVEMGSLEHAILFYLTLTICFCSYVVGLGPIPNILCSEMFPTRARATCASICSLSFWFGGLLSAYCFPVMLSTIGLGGACVIYAFVCCIALIFIYFRIPEPKGLPLELIAEVFKLSRHGYVQ